MMRLRGLAKKYVYGAAPYFRGRFPYYGHTVYFPRGSHIFERACIEGVYERETTDLIISLVEPGTIYIDIGANIGLLSVPVLAARPGVKVLSVEASPHTLPFLRHTHAVAPRRSDWMIVGAAVGAESGETEFWSAGGAQGAFDGLRDTGRGGPKLPVRVPVRTLDDIWRECGRPAVSVVKMDIEGGESLALQGAQACIASTKPILIIEWTEKNLKPYGISSAALFQLSADLSYAVYAAPSLVPINSEPVLKVAMTQTETFVLAPLS